MNNRRPAFCIFAKLQGGFFVFLHIEYLADILTVGDLEERVAVVDELMKNGKITFLQDYTTRKKKEDMRHERRNDADLAL